jgi:hypothetical protein
MPRGAFQAESQFPHLRNGLTAVMYLNDNIQIKSAVIGAGRVAQVVEHPLSKHETLRSNLSANRNKPAVIYAFHSQRGSLSLFSIRGN